MRVAVAWSPRPGEAIERAVELAAGATVADALAAAGVEAVGPIGIWGRIVAADAVVAADDRIELHRPLPVDAKEARRRRAAGQRAERKRR